jgi:hypothetical protein
MEYLLEKIYLRYKRATRKGKTLILNERLRLAQKTYHYKVT